MQSVDDASSRLRKALYGNQKEKEKEVLEIVINNDLETRLSIAKYYEAVYTTPLQDDLKAKLNPHFRNLVMDLFLSPVDYDVQQLKTSFKGFSIDEGVIFEIITSRSKDMLDEIKKIYKAQNGKEIKQEIEKNFGNPFKKNLITLLNTQRNVNSRPDKAQCERDAEILYSTQETNWSNDDIFNNIFALKSPEELVLIGRYYYRKTGVTLIDAIEKKMSGKVKTFFRELLYNVILPAELFAEKIYEAIKGIGTNTTILNRVLATRNEIDMPEIRELYFWKYKVNMKDDIIGDTSGNYQNLCVYLSEK